MNNTETTSELQESVNYNPVVKQEFKAMGTHTIENVKDNEDVLTTDEKLEVNKNYIVSFKNDDIIKVEKK